MKAKLLIIVFSQLLLLCIANWIVIQKHNSKIANDRKELNKKIDILFRGKDVIADGEPMQITGELNNRHYTLSNGGFTIYKLSKESGGFVKYEDVAGDIDYNVDEYTNDYFGYYKNYLWLNPKEVYNNAYQYLLYGTEENKDNSYTENTFTDIKYFPDSINSSFYILENTSHPTENYLDTTSQWSISNAYYVLNYYKIKKYYSIIEDSPKIKRSLIKSLTIGNGVAILIGLLIAVLINMIFPDDKYYSMILNTKWKDIDNNTIMTIENDFWGKKKVTILDNEKIKRGIAKFSENGQNLELLFHDTALIYEVKLSEISKLELENLASNKVFHFEKLGSNAYKFD